MHSRGVTSSAAAPPELLRLVGHPLRWTLLGALAHGDHTVHELTARVGEAQNLVSYHLGKLRTARLVTARRSSADGRDTYYSADLTRIGAQLVATAGALHPGLVAPPPPVTWSGAGPASVLFLCTGNSARSQMAEALTIHRSDGAVRASSAGSHPKPLHPRAVAVMRDEYGIDIEAHETKHLDRYTTERFDRVITLCDRVREVCPDFPGVPEPAHWSIADPAADPDDAAFSRTAAELDRRITFLLARLAAPAPTP